MGKGTCEKGYESHITAKHAKGNIFESSVYQRSEAAHPKASVGKTSSESGNSHKEKV